MSTPRFLGPLNSLCLEAFGESTCPVDINKSRRIWPAIAQPRRLASDLICNISGTDVMVAIISNFRGDHFLAAPARFASAIGAFRCAHKKMKNHYIILYNEGST